VRHALDTREVSAWVDADRLDRATRVLSDPRLRPTRVGSPDARTRRALTERFGAEGFDDIRRLAVATPSVLWIEQSAPLGEFERAALLEENIAIVAGACTLPFLLALPQAETAPSFRRMAAGASVIGIAEAFGRVEVLQSTVAVGEPGRLAEGLRVAIAAALAVLGPIDLVTAVGASAGTIAASLVGEKGFGTIAVASGVEGATFSLVGEGGIANVSSCAVAWRRRDGSWVEEARIEPDGEEPIVRTILEAERPVVRRKPLDESLRRMRLRIAAVADTVRLSARTGQGESVEAMLRNFGVDPDDLMQRS
jgi:hypothetical protein